MKVLIVGGGGREHALAWKFSQSPLVDELYCAPGNGGTAAIAVNVPIKNDEIKKFGDYAMSHEIDLTIVGPEAPLVAGLQDHFVERGLKVFGPSRAAARLEGSKAFAKELMERYGIPTGTARSFGDAAGALAYLRGLDPPYVVKADGLAAGKGVTVSPDLAGAERAVREALEERRFGEAGASVLIEEFLPGPEVSMIAFTDGRNILPMAPARDYKRVGDRDEGPNTGGMGSYSPVPLVDDAMYARIVGEVFEPLARAFAEEGFVYRGIIYAGLALTPDGPKVVEFNVRFGDPETQAIIPRLKSDIAELTLAAAEGDLSGVSMEWDERCCVTLTVASSGYPGEYDTGFPITGLQAASGDPDVAVFHAGTRLEAGVPVTAGGRVLNVSALGRDFEAARRAAYGAAAKLGFDGIYYRTDIALNIH
ncbi:MAG: phosphoribosylamine--glycine ligase [Candidatus Geothermincolia bacterium]